MSSCVHSAALMHLRWLPLFIALLPLNACTAHSLSTLQSESDQLQIIKAACTSNAAVHSETGQCLTSLDTSFLDLARKARDAAPEAEDNRTLITFVAIAALSGWSSQTEEGAQISDSAFGEGHERCAALIQETTYSVPRDCGLLQFAPAFARHARAVAFLNSIERAALPLDPGVAAGLHEQSVTYVGSTWDFVEAKRQDLMANHTLNNDLRNYLKDQERPIYCTTLKFATWAARVADNETRADLRNDMDRMTTANDELTPEMCASSVFGLS